MFFSSFASFFGLAFCDGLGQYSLARYGAVSFCASRGGGLVNLRPDCVLGVIAAPNVIQRLDLFFVAFVHGFDVVS
jgi:hypothetical protein